MLPVPPSRIASLEPFYSVSVSQDVLNHSTLLPRFQRLCLVDHLAGEIERNAEKLSACDSQFKRESCLQRQLCAKRVGIRADTAAQARSLNSRLRDPKKKDQDESWRRRLQLHNSTAQRNTAKQRLTSLRLNRALIVICLVSATILMLEFTGSSSPIS